MDAKAPPPEGWLVLEMNVPAGMSFQLPPQVQFMLDRGDAYMEQTYAPDGFTVTIRTTQRAVSQSIITDPTGTPALGLTSDPLSALRECLAFSSRDWSQEADLAWLYGIILGWDADGLDESDVDVTQGIADRFGWDAAKVARLRTLRAAFASLD